MHLLGPICRICEDEPATIADLCATCHEFRIGLAMELCDAELAWRESAGTSGRCPAF